MLKIAWPRKPHQVAISEPIVPRSAVYELRFLGGRAPAQLITAKSRAD
ncbi:hypothetical protein Jab_2c22960 [Janthinobacterium sp. HH01]|nr:hypothetical protein Jab_2c22960 [Janthinobacterium sp. HH01]